MAYTGLYNATGQQQVNIVNGLTYTGLYSPDGQFNGVINDGTSVIKGAMHPCGAFNVAITTDPSAGAYAPNGSRYIITSSNGYALLGSGKQSSPVGPLDGLSPTAAWSPSRKLLSTYNGSFYTAGTGRVDTLFDQSGTSNDMTQSVDATRPTIDISTGVAALSFNGSNQLTKTAATTAFISAANGYMIATVRNASFGTDSPAQPYANACALQDNGQNCGFTFSNNSGSPLYYVGSDPNYLSKSIVAGTTYVIEWRHEGGVLYQRTNGTGETSVAAGNTNVSGTSMRMGAAAYNGLIYEMATFSTVPAVAARNALVQNLGLYAGAAV